MARARSVATLLVVAVLMSAAVAGAAVPPRNTLKPTPPHPLPAPGQQHLQQSASPSTHPAGLPNTGVDARSEVAVALLMLGAGALVKALLEARPAPDPRRR